MEIIINSQAIDENMVSQVKQVFVKLIDQLENLNLSSLQYIIIPDDFGIELLDFQRRHGLREGYTNNEVGVALGKVLTYLEDGNYSASIYIDPRVVHELFLEETWEASMHIIHHEFCHVHDDYVKYRLFGVTDFEELFFNSPDKVRQVSYAHANMIWSEYIATRLSAGSKPEDHDLYVESLLILVTNTKENCEGAIQLYRTDHDKIKLFGKIQLSCSSLLKFVGYFIGYCHGINFDPPEEINSFIKEYPYFDGVWGELAPKLQKLYDTYGNWTDVKVFDDLASTIIQLWGNVGVYPENKDGAFNINVP